ncbi:hypothetical protein GQ44DRAFT_700372 [Phaeosphaeriaceae sp. PMI808]|nr:hypothetical protein GQ44DRAFT_700372 [Phaeosphaeriaceae sp. PMI808]
MTSLFPHTPFAEDQPNAHSILYLHVMRASAMSFSFVSLFNIPITLVRNRKAPLSVTALMTRTIQSSGRAFALGTVVGALATWGRMRGKEEIEWQDRAWRILENKGEVQTDWIALGGIGTGAVAGVVAARRGVIPTSIGRAVLGGAGVGSAVGIPYMISTFVVGRKPA